jgi:hypothetical protein
MSISRKIDLTWTEVQDVYVKQESQWKRAKKVFVKSGGVWKETHSSLHTLNISTDVNNLDLDNEAIDRFNDVKVIVNSGVTVASTNINTPSFKTGVGYGGTLTIVNNGNIWGCGGIGGTGASTGCNSGGYWRYWRHSIIRRD